jgi:hypothetical protein
LENECIFSGLICPTYFFHEYFICTSNIVYSGANQKFIQIINYYLACRARFFRNISAKSKKAGFPPRWNVLTAATAAMMAMRRRLTAIGRGFTARITWIVVMAMMTMFPLLLAPFHVHSEHLRFIAMTHFHMAVHVM